MSHTEPTELDGALAVEQAISRRIRVAAERGDTVAVEKFTRQHRIATVEIDRVLSALSVPSATINSTTHERNQS